MLETKDLILKSGLHEDWVALYRNLWSREEAFHYMFNRISETEEHARKRTAAYVEMQKEIPTEYFVYEKISGQAIGIAGMKEMSPHIFTITDIALGPDFWRKGYGKQILKALITQAFETFDAKELRYDCFEENLISKQLALSCGFSYTHSEKAELLKNGKNVILDYYKI